MAGPTDVTMLLARWSNGDKSALDELAPLLYDELRRVAGGVMRGERPNLTIQPTDLVHEAYLRMADQTRLQSRDRAHFLALAARAMRQILVDHWRRRKAAKRGGGVKIQLEPGIDVAAEKPAEVVTLDDALQALAEIDPRKAQVIELRFFGGMTAAEIAEVLGVSTATVGREIRFAQAWLHRELRARGAAERETQ